MRYTTIVSDIWADPEMLNASHEEKLLYLYLLTSPHGNQAGFYKLPKQFVDMTFNKNVGDLLEKPSKLFKYDSHTGQVLIHNYLKYNTIKSASQITGVLKALNSLSLCPLFIDFARDVYKVSNRQILKGLDNRVKEYLLTDMNGEEDSEIRLCIRDI